MLNDRPQQRPYEDTGMTGIFVFEKNNSIQFLSRRREIGPGGRNGGFCAEPAGNAPGTEKAWRGPGIPGGSPRRLISKDAEGTGVFLSTG